MSFHRKRFLFLLLIFVIYGAYLFTHSVSHTTTHQVLGTSANLQLFEEPQDGKIPLITAINSAQKEILVEVYLLSDKDILSALASAEQRGVLVKVMMEQHPFGSGSLNTKTQQILISAHIAAEWTNPTFSLTHEKTIVIDDAEAFILNQNLTTSAFSKNREYDILDTNPIDVNEVRSIFIADWERQSFTPKDENLVVSPQTSRSGLETLLQSAKKNIEIEVEDIGDKEVEQILSDKATTVSVEIITPTLSQLASNKQALDILTKAGVSVKKLSSPYIHAKLIIVDNAKAYVGSVNLSTQSMDENREVGIILSQQDILEKLQTSFIADWQKASN